MTPLIIDNFAPQSFLEKMKEHLEAPGLPWYFNNSTVDYIENAKPDDSFQFTHLLYGTTGPTSQQSHIFYPLVYYFEQATGKKVTRVVRMKSNMLLQRDIPKINPAHTDHLVSSHMSMILYINESDGNTVFYEEYYDSEKEQKNAETSTIAYTVEPVVNRAVIFDSLKYHASSCPTQHKNRIVVNCVFTVE